MPCKQRSCKDWNKFCIRQSPAAIHPQSRAKGPTAIRHATNMAEAESPSCEEKLFVKIRLAIYGGAAGGGKTYALLLEPLRHIGNSEFGCVAFRKTSNQITAEGGLWDTSYLIYPQCGGEPRKTPPHSWTFPSGMKITFAHIQLEKNVLDWQGTQIPLIMFDELTHFSKSRFFYMLSRNRSGSGVKGYIRASCNPDASSWVAEFINWWWDPKTGYVIPERSGKIRWMYRLNDEIHWADH